MLSHAAVCWNRSDPQTVGAGKCDWICWFQAHHSLDVGESPLLCTCGSFTTAQKCRCRYQRQTDLHKQELFNLSWKARIPRREVISWKIRGEICCKKKLAHPFPTSILMKWKGWGKEMLCCTLAGKGVHVLWADEHGTVNRKMIIPTHYISHWKYHHAGKVNISTFGAAFYIILGLEITDLYRGRFLKFKNFKMSATF